MEIIKRKKTLTCTDGTVVYEYTLSEPVHLVFIDILERFGHVQKRRLGGLVMFTFQKDDWCTLKGISDDPIIYVTYPKTDTQAAEEFINTLVSAYNKEFSEKNLKKCYDEN